MAFIRTVCICHVGGQIEFQESLPLLMARPAIFVYLFPLNVDLDNPVTVSYRKKVGDKIEHTNIYTSPLTITESILQTLYTIATMKDNSNPISTHKPFLLLVGTHRDCLERDLGREVAGKKIAEVNSRLKSLLVEHNFEDIVVYANRSNEEIFFAVDNTCDSTVFQKIRSSVFELIHSQNQFHIECPLSYLHASLHLQNSSQPFIKRSDFVKDILQYGINETDVDHVLRFLHSKIGQILYFPVEGIKEVIVKPQALYNLMAHVIAKSFFSSDRHSEIQKGIYSIESFADYEHLLSHTQVISLLKELHVVAPFYDQKARCEKYFIPCTLKHLPEEPVEDTSKTSIVQPLAILFDRGRCPKGLFSVLLHYIITHPSKKLSWDLNVDKIFRDSTSFEVGFFKDLVTIKFFSTRLEVDFAPVNTTQRSESSLKEVCSHIRYMVISGTQEAIESLHYSTKYSIGLACTKCQRYHKVIQDKSEFLLQCPVQVTAIPVSGSCWFGSKSVMFLSKCR